MLQSTNIVEMTLYDTLYGIYEIAQEKAQLFGDNLESFVKQRGSIIQIADEFCDGSKYSKQTTRTLAGAALGIKPAALSVLGEIMTEEDPSLTRRMHEQNAAEPLEDGEVFDARAYKNIISTKTIRGATTFLNADARDQSNALIKLKLAYAENSFKCFQASRLNKETERSLRAHHQVHLMNFLMCRDKWPDELADIEKKLFVSFLFDSELYRHDENSDTILPSLIEEYRHRMSLEAGLRWRLYRAEREGSRVIESGGDTEETVGTEQGGSSNEEERRSSPDLGNEEQIPTGRRDLCPLERLKVNCMNMILERYSTHRPSNEDKFHLITGDPSQVQLNGTCKIRVGELEADKYIRIMKQLLHAHDWVFLYTRAADYGISDKVFRANGLNPLDYPWLMIRDTETVQENTSPIPQNVAELLIGARSDDDGTPSFQPFTDIAYKRAVSSRKRKFAITDHCRESRMKMKKRNTREPLRTNEKVTRAYGGILRYILSCGRKRFGRVCRHLRNG